MEAAIGFLRFTLGGLAAAFLVFSADIRRRRLPVNPIIVFALTAIAVLGSAAFFANRLPELGLLGALLAGAVTLGLWAKVARIPVWQLLDASCPAAALGYAVAGLTRAGSPLSHGQPLLQFALASALAVYLWMEGKRAVEWQRPMGLVCGEFLILLAGLRLASHWLFARLPGTLWPDLAQMAAGGAITAITVYGYFHQREEHRILQTIERFGEATQPEYANPTVECPHPERWKMYDTMTAEVEVLDFLRTLVLTVKPQLIVETGTFTAVSTLELAKGLRENGFGKIVTVEFDPKVYAKAKERIDSSGLAEWVECRNQSSLEMEVEGMIDLFFSDSGLEIREQEVRHFLPRISPFGLILMHDASSDFKIVREAAKKLENEGLISVVMMSTPRGLVVAQKREGRR